jgi:mannose-6-phosphate isomerase
MQDALYPLRFRPLFKTVLWGGTALRPMFGAAPSAEPTGEAWVLSDCGEFSSEIVNGPLAGRTLRDLMQLHRRELLGEALPSNGFFPLLLKFLDARLPLSVQVHPTDELATKLEPHGPGLGKTEAWVVLKSEDGRVYAGLREGVGREKLGAALARGTLPEILHSYRPAVGDCIFLEAGTVHAIGAGLMLFEVQQTSDITYRLYDWGRLDPKTGKPRALHVEQALHSTDYKLGPCNPMKPRAAAGGGEVLVNCSYFTLLRRKVDARHSCNMAGRCRIFVCIDGAATLTYSKKEYSLSVGDVLLSPAVLGQVDIVPRGTATILEIVPA